MDKKTKKIDEILSNELLDKGNLYGIFDGAIIEDLWLNIEHWNLKNLPLFKGDYEKIAEAIPYVIELDKEKDEEAYASLLGNIGENALLLVSSELSLKELTERMQFFYHIKTSDGDSALRRFYDPRIFTDFISGMNAENRLRFFEDVSGFFSEAQKGKAIRRFRKNGDQLDAKEFSLIDNEQI